MTPSVAVVVATYDRPDLLADLVASLITQDLPELEIVVVDDGSPQPVDARLSSDDGGGPTVRVVRLEHNGGQARARNVGWRSTDAEIVLFTDDDCRAASNEWARHLTAAMVDGEADVVQGHTREDRRDPEPLGPWDRTLRIRRWSGRFEACNIGYRRSVLEAADGFDESFRAGEDTDLGLRATAAGARGAFAGDAVIEHTIWRQDFRGYLRDRMRTVHLVRLVRRHPQLRSTLPLRVFWQKGHAKSTAGLAACGVAGAVRPALVPGVVALWIVVASRNASGSVPERLRVAGLRLVAGVVEVSAMAVASVRHRCLLL